MAAGFAAIATLLLLACARQTKTGTAPAAQAALIELRSAALIEIKDPARARAVFALIDQLRQEDREARDAVAGYRQRVRAIDANYESSDEELRKVFAEFNQERIDRQRRV